jgi:hypothetical protein
MRSYVRMWALAVVVTGVTAQAASAADRVPVSGQWQSVVNCAFTSYDPLTGSMSCVGSTRWTGGLRGLTAYKVTGTYDALTGDSNASRPRR